MIKNLVFALMAWSLFSCGPSNHTQSTLHSNSPMETKSFYDFTINSLEGRPVSLGEFRNKVVLVVNVASKCGYTPQYKDLEAFYRIHKDRGFVILGFPANNFGAQEPGTHDEIAAFCEKNYGVTFPMFEKISVTGPDTHPLYQWLTHVEQNGVLNAEVKWNFNKFLLDRSGKLVGYYESKQNVTAGPLAEAIEKELGR